MDSTRADSRDASSRDDLAKAIRGCNARIDDIESSSRTLRFLLTGASLGLVAMAGMFGWSLWSALQRQLAPEKLELALTSKLETIGPPLGQKLADEVIAAVPAYSELAIKRGEKVWPELSARIAGEADTFAAATETMVRQRADKAVERVAARLVADLKRDFPKLTEARCEQIAKRLQAGLITEGAGLGEEVQATIGKERSRLEVLLAKLPIEEASLEPESRLQKRFMRGVLQSIDAAVAEWPTDDDGPGSPPSAGVDSSAPRNVIENAPSNTTTPAETVGGDPTDPPPSADDAEPRSVESAERRDMPSAEGGEEPAVTE